MDFLDPKKRRAHRHRLIIGYVLMGVAILTATFILVLITNGYGFDRKKGTIVQNGLVFVSAHPESARIFINGQDRGDTDGRFVLEEGKYKLELQRQGYRTWSREFTLSGSSIERFIYPFLFPEKLVGQDVQAYDSQPDLVTVSPDRHWIIVHRAAVPNSFWLIDTSKKQDAVTAFSVPATILVPREGQALAAVEWSTDNRHVLLKQTYNGGVTHIMLDREQPASSVNINDALGRSFTQIALRDKRFDQLYVYDSGLLETADLKTKALVPVARNVVSFWPYGSDIVLFTTTDGAPGGKALVKLAQSDKVYTLRTVAASTDYMLNIAEFSGSMYVVVGSAAEGRAYLYEDPLGVLKRGTVAPTVKALLKTPGAKYVSFSANARFVAVQGGATFAIYDAEDNRQYRYDTKLVLAADQKATWMDGHRLTLINQDKLSVFDFDGTNLQTLNGVIPGVPAMFDQGYTALYTLSPSVGTAGKTAVVRTSLLVNK